MQAANIAAKLNKAKPSNLGWMACCPAHDDTKPSLSLLDGENGRLLVKCFAGCSAQDVMTVLKQRGLLNNEAATRISCTPLNQQTKKYKSSIDWVQKIWNDSQPTAGTPVESYLQKRGYTRPVPPTLRYHPRLFHSPTKQYMPAMVGAVALAPERHVIGIHRTFLTPNGDKAPVKQSKMCLGSVGGGAVRLAPATTTLAIAEGIETGLSVMQATDLSVWAALSAGGITKLILPYLPLASEIIICADNDANGVGQRAAQEAAARWIAEGRQVRIALPPHVGQDFNDVLMEGIA